MRKSDQYAKLGALVCNPEVQAQMREAVERPNKGEEPMGCDIVTDQSQARKERKQK
jgi:hypothetical protein